MESKEEFVTRIATGRQQSGVIWKLWVSTICQSPVVIHHLLSRICSLFCSIQSQYTCCWWSIEWGVQKCSKQMLQSRIFRYLSLNVCFSICRAGFCWWNIDVRRAAIFWRNILEKYLESDNISLGEWQLDSVLSSCLLASSHLTSEVSHLFPSIQGTHHNNHRNLLPRSKIHICKALRLSSS